MFKLNGVVFICKKNNKKSKLFFTNLLDISSLIFFDRVNSMSYQNCSRFKFIWACKHGNLSHVIRYWSRVEYHLPGFHVACVNNQSQVVEYMIKYINPVHCMFGLLQAFHHQNIELLTLFLELKPYPDGKLQLLLGRACQKKSPDMINLLLKYTTPNCRVLKIAVIHGNIELLLPSVLPQYLEMLMVTLICAYKKDNSPRDKYLKHVIDSIKERIDYKIYLSTVFFYALDVDDEYILQKVVESTLTSQNYRCFVTQWLKPHQVYRLIESGIPKQVFLELACLREIIKILHFNRMHAALVLRRQTRLDKNVRGCILQYFCI